MDPSDLDPTMTTTHPVDFVVVATSVAAAVVVAAAVPPKDASQVACPAWVASDSQEELREHRPWD